MTLDYRIMRKIEGRGCTHWYSYGVYEVFYEKGGKLSWTEEPIYLMGDTMKEIADEMTMILKALEKPILDWKTGKEIKNERERKTFFGKD